MTAITNPQHKALVEALGKGAVNVERARMNGIAEYLAGWEHKTMLEAADAIAALSATAATPSDEEVPPDGEQLADLLEHFDRQALRDEVVRLREFAERVRDASCAWSGQARAALEPQAKDL